MGDREHGFEVQKGGSPKHHLPHWAPQRSDLDEHRDREIRLRHIDHHPLHRFSLSKSELW